MPSSATAFLHASGRDTGSVSRAMATATACSRVAAQTGAVALSISTRIPARRRPPRVALVASEGLKQGMEAALAACRQVGGDPGFGRLVGDLDRREGRGVALRPAGARVAAVVEDRRLGGEPEAEAG